MNKLKARPIYLNLFQIRMPVAAVVSILHRLSGFILISCLPLFIYMFDLSVSDEAGFAEVKAMLDLTLVKYLGSALVWLTCHHFCAGVRFLLIDIDVGLSKSLASKGAWAVHACALFLTFVIILGMK